MAAGYFTFQETLIRLPINSTGGCVNANVVNVVKCSSVDRINILGHSTGCFIKVNNFIIYLET